MLENYIIREKCVIADEDLEILNSEEYPVFCGCVPHDSTEKDILATQTFAISKHGVIQLKSLIPLDILYKYGHDAGSVGNLWESHHKEFAKFILEAKPQKVLEIGGGHSLLALNCLKQKAAQDVLSETSPHTSDNDISWSIVEPNVTKKYENINYIESFFTKDLLKDGYDTVVHSHVFEHIYDPHGFLADIAESFNSLSGFSFNYGGGGQMLFSIPNMQKWLEYKWTNTLNFEHTILLTENIVEYLLSKHGFKIHKKHYFGEHSIFYHTKYDNNLRAKTLQNDYEINKKLFLNMRSHYNKQIATLNIKLKQTNKDVYLFGAHLFSQYLLYHGLYAKNIRAILDNNRNKHNKRLYGTTLLVYPPQILANISNALVVLNAGAYNKEIKEQLSLINSGIEIIVLDELS